MRRMRVLNIVLALLLAVGGVVSNPVQPAYAATTLAAGDIAIIGFNYDDVDEFAFVLLVDVTAGTTINFTDNGWLAAGGFRAGEGTITWTAATDLTAGTVINPPLGSGLFALSTSGDQILAYQGTSASPVFIYALNSEGTGWQTDATSTSTSALPTGLVNGTSAVAINEIDNAVYTGITSGTKTQLLAAIGNTANWSGSDTVRQTMPGGPFTVTSSGDSAPTVTSTVPANGASGVAVNTTLVLNFSEAVTLGTGYALTCGGNAVTSNITNNGTAAITLTPTAALPFGSSCTLAIPAAQVTDVDANDPPDAMAADYSMSFTTAADLLPTVTSTVPANGASGVTAGANLTVNFSEAVNIASGWYSVSCSISGSHTGTVTPSGGPAASFSIDPSSDFSPGESCTAAITAAQVTDVDGTPDAMAADFSWGFTVASGAGCGSLFLSEYIEGSSNNKAIEIYNGTGAAVDLDQYQISVYSNGSPTPSSNISITSGTVLPNGEVYVIANTSANAAILGVADQLSGSLSFNGDDAVALRLVSSGALVDVIGQIGFDPGAAWGSGATTTADHTLNRKVGISAGDTNGADVFDPATEWDGYASDTTSDLGMHTAACSGGDFAPRVVSTSPADGASGVTVGANLTVTFSEDVTTTGTWYEISCSTSGAHSAAVTGGPKIYTLNPDVDFTTPETCSVMVYAAQVQDLDAPLTNMTEDFSWAFSVGTPAAPCSTISLIQGTGNASPCLGTRSNIQGCVTGVASTGFYFQAVPGDGLPATSDGVYVYRGAAWTNPEGLVVGDLVSVSGKVVEYYNTTEFTTVTSVTKTGTCTLPAPVTIPVLADPAANPMTLLEKYEGMRVQMSFDGWVTGPTKRYTSRYAYGDPEIVFVDYSSSISDDSRVFQSDYPGYQGLQYITGGLGFDLPDLDFGDRITGSNISGVLGYQFDKYALLVDSASGISTVDNPDISDVEAALDPLKREFSVCYYNVENLFDNINDGHGDFGDWAPGYPTSGDAAGLAVYQAHLTETANVLVNGAKACMIIGLEEVEGKQQVYNDLAAKLNAIGGGYTWTAIYVESGDPRDISQGFLYRNDVTLLSGPTPVSGAPYTTWVSDSTLDFRRVPASAKFRLFPGSATQTDIIVYGLHFKSKGSSTSCTTPDCTDIREKEAADLRDILGHHQDAGEYAIAGGDFNDYINSTPIGILNASSKIQSLFTELPAVEQYSYIFSGESEVLDHMYITNNLKPANGSIWKHTFSPVHVNANFPSAEHASDHDPLRTVFSFYVDNGSGGPGADLTDLALSYDLAWHKSPHALWLGGGVSNDTAYGVDADAEDGDLGIKPLFSTPWKEGNTVQINVTVGGTGSGWLSGWFDWNKDGDFNDAGEKAVNQAVSVGSQVVSLVIPAGAQVGNGVNSTIPVRFRLYESASEPAKRGAEIEGGGQIMAALSSGAVSGGEVFDARWGFTPTAITLKNLQAHPAQPSAWPWLLVLCAMLGAIFILRKKQILN